MIDAIIQCLEADPYLTQKLVGGIYGNTEVSRQLTPDAFDECKELRPTALVTLGESVHSNVVHPFKEAYTQPFDIYLYERREPQRKNAGAARGIIQPAAFKVKEILNCKRLEPCNRLLRAREIEFTGAVNNGYDDDIDAKMIVLSFQVEMDRADSCC